MSKQLTLTFLNLFILSSCTIRKDLERDFGPTTKIAPDRWAATQQAQTGIDTHWLYSFDDPILLKLVEKSWKNSPRIHQSAAKVSQALALIKDSKVYGSPTLDLEFSPNRSRNVAFFIDPDNPFSTQFNTFNLGLSAEWEPDFWGKFRAGTQAESSRAQAAAHNLQAAKASLAGQVAKTWFSLIEKNLQIQLTNQTLKINEETLAATKRRYNSGNINGGGTAIGYNQLKIDLLSRQADLASLTQEKNRLSRRLEILTGDYPKGDVSTSHTLPDLNDSIKSGIPSDLLLRRPDILAAERNYAASKGFVKQAKRAIYPNFPLSASFGTSSNQLRNILKSEFGVWQIASDIVQPILTGGKVKAELQKRKGSQAEALAVLHQTVLNAFEEVENALSNDQSLKTQLDKLKEALSYAEKNQKLTNKQFKSGLVGLNEKLNAQSQTIIIQNRLLSLQLAQTLNRIDLHLSLGGDIELKKK